LLKWSISQFLGLQYLFCQLAWTLLQHGPLLIYHDWSADVTAQGGYNRLRDVPLRPFCYPWPTSCLNCHVSSPSSYSLDPMITSLCIPLPNVNIPCPLLFWLVIIVIFHCRDSSPAQYALANPLVPPPTHVVTSPGLIDVSRDNTSLIVTQCLGLPPLYSHPTIPLSVHYALNLFYHTQKPAPFTLCYKRTRQPVLIAFSRTLILLLLCSSGDVEVNPGLFSA
jgi:hypothetical protein